MKKQIKSPPKLAEWLVTAIANRKDKRAIIGDLEEEYYFNAKSHGIFYAYLWYWSLVVISLPSFIMNLIFWSITMFKHNLKTAVRNLGKFKSISSINIVGLSAGMAVCILLMLYVQDELSYDRFHQHSDRIFRILENDNPYISPQVSEIASVNFPEIERSARILVRDQCLVQYEEKKFIEKQFCFTDPNLFSIFSFKLKNGDPATVLKQPFSIVISEAIAQKYFGEENPIGKVLKLQNELDYTITGLMEEMPYNSHFRYSILATLTSSDQVFGLERMSSWGWRNIITYLLVQDSFSGTSFGKKLSTFVSENRDYNEGENPSTYTVQALEDIHLYSGFIDNDIQVQGNISYVLIFSGIGILILLIACFNYVNLLTANATTRAKEVGIKKVVGSSRNQLVRQFIGESIVILMIALSFAFALSYLCLPLFNILTGKTLSLAILFSSRMVLSILGILVFTSLLSGFYPAFVLSSFQPAKTLKSSKSSGHTKLSFGRVIVGGQFTISIILIACALFMAKQLHFLQTEKLGYNKEHIIITDFYDTEESQKYEILKNELLQNSNITSITAASRFPSDDLNNWGAIQLPGQSEFVNMPFVHVNFDYFKTFGISAMQGRLFSNKMETDGAQALILNEIALKKLGLNQEVIGKSVQITWPYSKREIIGVVKDFHFESLYNSIQPVAFVISPEKCWKMAIKVRASHLNETLTFIENKWKTFYPEWVFKHQFVDERVGRYYDSEKRTFQLMSYFTFLAIFVACLGLFGLVSFIIKRRFKEIAVRKVLGAPIINIFKLLTGELLWGILLANLIAWPIAWYVLNKWLQNFAYRTSLSLWIFLVASISVMAIALLTMSWQTFRAARINPVDSLKYE